LKKYILFFVFGFTAVIVKAQSGYGYLEYGVGFGVSYLRPYDDLIKANNSFAYNVNFDYNLSPYIPISTEVQYGKLSGGSVVTDQNNRQYSNHYIAVILHGDLQLGEVIQYGNNDLLNIVKNFYFGSGIGAISNNLKTQRTAISDPTYRFPGQDKSINMIIPLRFGYEFKLYNNDINDTNLRFYVGYVHNITFGEGLDGYTDPSPHFKNNNPDQYRQITVGVKLNFGNEAVYTKMTRPF